jgi:hypothetical protein
VTVDSVAMDEEKNDIMMIGREGDNIWRRLLAWGLVLLARVSRAACEPPQFDTQACATVLVTIHDAPHDGEAGPWDMSRHVTHVT